jgi:hypothetical protein
LVANNEAATREQTSKPTRSDELSVGRAFMPDAVWRAAGKIHRRCLQQPHGWSTRSNNEAATREQTSKPAPSHRLSVGRAFMPDALSRAAEKTHHGGFQQPHGWSTRSNNEAVTRKWPSKPAPSHRLSVGRAFMPDALSRAAEKIHRGCLQQPHGRSTRSNNEAATREQPSKPAPSHRLSVGRAFMPDALSRAAEKTHHGGFQQPHGWSTRSNNEAATREQTSKPVPSHRLSVGRAFMPDALSRAAEKIHRGGPQQPHGWSTRSNN